MRCTALRAEAALRARLPKDAKRNASISPYDKGLGEVQCFDPFQNNDMEEQKFPCTGELMQHTRQGTHSFLQSYKALCSEDFVQIQFQIHTLNPDTNTVTEYRSNDPVICQRKRLHTN